MKKLSTNGVVLVSCGFLSIVSLLSVWVGRSGRAFELNENQVLYLFSTTSQVLAAIYGLTLTGFIFFRNELSREELEDETLTEVVTSLKQRYFILLFFITFLVISTFLLSNLVMSNEASGKTPTNTALLNITQSLFATSLIVISYFIFDVIEPNRIEIASKSLKDKLDRASPKGGKGKLEDFLRNYNQIEQLLADVGESYNKQMMAGYAASTVSPRRRTSNSRLAEILLRNERINFPLFESLKGLITLRNSIIHGGDPVVSQEMVRTSDEVLQGLRLALQEQTEQFPLRNHN